MPIDRARCRQHLKQARFTPLFIEELGWDRHIGVLPITVDGTTYTLQAVAEKRGMQVYLCQSPPDGRIPEYPLRRKIETQVSKAAYEHLIIYLDGKKTTHTWQWARREAGQSTVCREHTYHQGQAGDSLLQKLEHIAFSLDEEAKLTLPAVTARTRAAFDVEKLTKRFYDRFKTEHAAFLEFLRGIPDGDLPRWYASVLINRLMFIYFIQRKGFLDRDPDYLPHKLATSMAAGPDRFYRDFLCPLFFEGFARKEEDRSPQTRALLGDIPYLDGGLFQQHQIEQAHGQTIQVPDAPFQRLFRFFDEWQWTLDDRPTRADNEINPDVLGYIFEKYINQKQMGAYYTREDITGYICRNTILPFLFTKLAGYRHEAGTPFPLRDIEPYIYPAVAQEAYLPTETQREYAARQVRLESIRADLAVGKIASIDDFITYNLDIERFVQDWLRELTDPLTLRAFYFKCLAELTVLDPTVGSGAFLFAALNILAPLYEACLDRMEQLQDGGYRGFRQELARIAGHPNRRYFILKSIVVNNLFGVDIMEEAVEICKLRLFLKLVAQLEPGHPLEPLPDIDFNIRAGNSLVGFASLDAVRQAMATKPNGQTRMLFPEEEKALREIEESAEIADRAYQRFQEQQTIFGGPVTSEDKRQLRGRLEQLEERLNLLLAGEYGFPPGDVSYPRWRISHQPFHWFVEFYGVLNRGGFDVIVGNPPWREYAAVRTQYRVRGYQTEGTGNLYALCTERALALRGPRGWFSFIVQLPLTSASRMAPVRSLLVAKNKRLFVSTFDDRPGRLFEGLEHCRATIVLAQGNPDDGPCRCASTAYQRWPSEARDNLFAGLQYTSFSRDGMFPDRFPKQGSVLQGSAFSKVAARGTASIGSLLRPTATENYIFYQEATQYWVKATLGLPYYAKNRTVGAPAHGRFLFFDDIRTASAVCCVLNSTLFYAYFVAYGDCFHLSQELVSHFPITTDLTKDDELLRLCGDLMNGLRANAERKTIQTKDGDCIEYEEFFCWKSKPTIDAIDHRLAAHYGLTADELGFILNYELKHRVGHAALPDNSDLPE